MINNLIEEKLKEAKKKKASISLTIDWDIKKKLDDIAKEKGIHFSTLVNICLEVALLDKSLQKYK
jgi:antitoxin component of RelBE/YafQ-DinJ toxin-antitoxin module